MSENPGPSRYFRHPSQVLALELVQAEEIFTYFSGFGHDMPKPERLFSTLLTESNRQLVRAKAVSHDEDDTGHRAFYEITRTGW
eukprot:9262717-Karenia_brevis.AAC.1